MLLLSFVPIFPATATTSLTAPEFSEFSNKLSNITDLSIPSSSASAVTSTTSLKLSTKSVRKLELPLALTVPSSLFLRFLCAPPGELGTLSESVVATKISAAASIASTATPAFLLLGFIKFCSDMAPKVAEPLLSAPADLADLLGSASLFCSCCSASSSSA